MKKLLISIVACSGLLAACGGGGSSVETQSTITTKTAGQELIDLKKALDSGAITQEEYDKLRKKVMDR